MSTSPCLFLENQFMKFKFSLKWKSMNYTYNVFQYVRYVNEDVYIQIFLKKIVHSWCLARYEQCWLPYYSSHDLFKELLKMWRWNISMFKQLLFLQDCSLFPGYCLMGSSLWEQCLALYHRINYIGHLVSFHSLRPWGNLFLPYLSSLLFI